MSNGTHKLLEHIFFFTILGAAAYLLWMIFAPFIGAIALAAIVVTICYPMHERIMKYMPKQNQALGAFASLATVILVVITPLALLGSLILKEALSIYTIFNSTNHISLLDSLSHIEVLIQKVVPTFSFDISSVIQQTASFVVDHLVSLFAGTASTIFLFFIALIACYYFFKDGKYFTTYLIKLSPLKDADDTLILKRLALAVRSVALGTVSVSLIQGILTALGLSIVGFDRAILLGCVAAIGALVPGVGTAIVIVPSVIYLFATGEQLSAIGLGLWGLLAVGLIDNLLGPYMMSKGNNLHPFLILISVLGGLSLFGPIGFILGPVILSFFLVLLELYHQYIKREVR